MLQDFTYAYQAAKGFEKTAELISIQLNQKMDLGLALSYGVNAAIAIELYTKILLSLEKKETPEKTHKLTKLFNSLKKETQQNLSDEFLFKVQQTTGTYNALISHFGNLENILYRVLEETEKVCVSWRYYGFSTTPSSSVIGEKFILELLKIRIHGYLNLTT